MRITIVITLLVTFISCQSDDRKPSEGGVELNLEMDSITSDKSIETIFESTSKKKVVGNWNSNYQVFKPNQLLKSGNYVLKKLVYISSKNEYYLEFVDRTSEIDEHGNYEVTYHVYADHLTKNENILHFYGHSGELGEVQVHLILSENSKNQIVKMKGEISFLINSFKEVVFERTTVAE